MLCSTGTCVSAVWVAPYDRLRLTEAIMHLPLAVPPELIIPPLRQPPALDGWGAARLVHRLTE
jgi:hypothetical protein